MQQIRSLLVGNILVGLIAAVLRYFTGSVSSSGKSFFQRLKKSFALLIANEIQRTVGGNPVQPCGDFSITPETSGSPEYLQKNILRQVFRVNRTVNNSEAGIHDHSLIAFYQLSKGFAVALLNTFY